MSLHTPTYRRKPKDRQRIVLIVTIVLSLIIGLLAGIEFGSAPYHAFHDDMIEPNWVRGGLAATVTMIIGGIISGLMKPRNKQEEIFA